ncbi:uncharacterized protein LOC117585697 [Drosophila guanche]|uniref:Uncharacterized protein n=1 Tax=Drosophila guanche TaxID=7266 RepID=A0A3B0JM88_DROGU|nr:uncharacterized protein LOC117585697 [Drosophila guanche]SPP83345.1 Hypothetical predicted protein [Drosophila guanche]
MQRCYCGGSFGAGSSMRSALVQPQRPRGDLMSVTSSSRQSTRPTQFVRRPSLKSTVPGLSLGLGHSNTRLSNDFSRRNSTATSVSHCSSCSCSAAAQQRQQSRAKVLRWGWERTGGVSSSSSSNSNTIAMSSSSPQYTDNRRFYEQSACVASRQPSQGQGQVQSGNSAAAAASSSPSPQSPSMYASHNDELQQLQALQKFRLMNASECFSDVRQDELRLQQAYDKLQRGNTQVDTDKWHKNRDNRQQQQQQLNTGTTPYALRQKMLQLRLQADEEQGRGSGGTCAPMGRSCALRYN